DRKIDRDIPGSAQRVAADIAGMAIYRVRERRRVEPLLPVLSPRRGDGDARNGIWTRIAARIGKIGPGVNRVRCAGREPVNTDELSAVATAFRRAFQASPERQIVRVTGYKPVRLVVIGWPFLLPVIVLAANGRAVVEV